MKIEFDKINAGHIHELASLQPNGWDDITQAFDFFSRSSFCYPVKIVADNKLVGVGNAVTFNNSAWLSHIIVGEKSRNKGFGFYIVEHLLHYLKSKYFETILLIASHLGQSVYKKFGFKTVSNYIYLERKEPWIDKNISDKIVAYESRFYAPIIKLDNQISGEEREPLLKDFIDNSFVYVEDEEVKGFYIPTLGEGQIFADTTEAGIELMKLKYAKSDIAVIPEDNKAGLQFLLNNGFGPSKTTGKRMILGNQVSWQANKYYSRISGDFG